MPAPHSLIPLRISATSGTEIVLIQTLSSDTLNRILEYVDNTTRLDHLLKVGITGRAAPFNSRSSGERARQRPHTEKRFTMIVRQCPYCELRFLNGNELKDHISTDRLARDNNAESLPQPTTTGTR